MAGHRIIFSAYEDEYGASEIRLMDVEETLDDPLSRRFSNSKN